MQAGLLEMPSWLSKVKSWVSSSKKNGFIFRLSNKFQYLLIDNRILVEQMMNSNIKSKGFSFIIAFPG